MYTVTTAPLKQTKSEQANIKKLANRLDALLDDAIPLMHKYGMHERFKLK